jgi:hypothetical protein
MDSWSPRIFGSQEKDSTFTRVTIHCQESEELRK